MNLITASFLVAAGFQATTPQVSFDRSQFTPVITTILQIYPEVAQAVNGRGIPVANLSGDRFPASESPAAASIAFFTNAHIDFSVSTLTGRVHALSINAIPPETGEANFTAEQERPRIEQVLNALGYAGTLRVSWEARKRNRLQAEYQPVVAGAEFPVDAPVSVVFRPLSRVPETIWIPGVPALHVETSPLATQTQVEQAVATHAFPDSGFTAVSLQLGEPFYSRWSEMSLGQTQFNADDLAVRAAGKAVLVRQVIMGDVASYNPATQEFARWQVVYVRAKTGRVMARLDYAGMSGGQTPSAKLKVARFDPQRVAWDGFSGRLERVQGVRFAESPKRVVVRSGGGLWRAEYEASSGLLRITQGDQWFRAVRK